MLLLKDNVFPRHLILSRSFSRHPEETSCRRLPSSFVAANLPAPLPALGEGLEVRALSGRGSLAPTRVFSTRLEMTDEGRLSHDKRSLRDDGKGLLGTAVG